MSAAPGRRLLDSIVVDANRGRLIGVEREYEIRADGVPTDARAIWPTLSDLGVHLDPGDPHARRGPSGGVLTVDGPHAEVATPPVVARPGCTGEVLALAAAGVQRLGARLGDRELVGYSTHINVQVPDRRVVRVARLLARRLSLPLMLALDRADSPGLLVRPRLGRLEIGGEFAAGDQLRVAVTLCVAMVRLAERTVLGSLPVRFLPAARLVPAVERFGWFVDRRAFGDDLYGAGRSMPIGSGSAGDWLRRAWELARPLVLELFDPGEIAAVDSVVEGTRALPLEAPIDADGPIGPVRSDRNYLPRVCAGVEVVVVRATWWRAVLQISGPSRTRWMTVPGRALDDLLDAMDDGRLDRELLALVDPPAGRALRRSHGSGQSPVR